MRYQSGVWHSEACYGTKPFVCKVLQATVSCPTVMPCVGHLACPPTFMYIDTTQSCYRVDFYYEIKNFIAGKILGETKIKNFILGKTWRGAKVA